MTGIPLGYSESRRLVASEPDIKVVNRFFEQDPTNQVEQAALIARPGLSKWKTVGDGPIRGLFSQPGAFSDALFLVSGTEAYRIDTDESATLIGSGIFGAGIRGTVYMAATPDKLFMADGRSLYLYMEDGFATGSLSTSGAIADADEVEIAGVYYQWTSGSVDAGTPDGTSGTPWLVSLGSDTLESLTNLYKALNASGVAGTTYSTSLTANADVKGDSATGVGLSVSARTAGTAGNSLSTTVVTGANLTWGAATLSGGGDPSFTTVATPDDVGVVSVGYIAGYVIVVVAQGYDVNGRFYYIKPGETTIDPLSYYTAERSPDGLWSVRVVGDVFWLFGVETSEVWYLTGDGTSPFARMKGQLFDRGVWPGTDVQIRDAVFLIDKDGIPVEVTASPEPIAPPGVIERIRRAIATQKTSV